MGERQQFLVRINMSEKPISKGTLLLEPQTEGLTICKTEKVLAKHYKKGDENEVKEIQLEMQQDDNKVILPACDAHDILEIFMVYEGSYTEFEYIVSLLKKKENE